MHKEEKPHVSHPCCSLARGHEEVIFGCWVAQKVAPIGCESPSLEMYDIHPACQQPGSWQQLGFGDFGFL